MRTQNSIRNTAVGLLAQFVYIIMAFICRTVFIHTLGVSYLGVNGLFVNILSMLSLAELGVGTAITYNLYKPLAEHDTRKIKALINLYSKAYQIIGISIAVIGLAITPFLNHFIKDRPDIPNLSLIYLLFLSNTVVSYFFAHKRAILIADQKVYIDSLNRMIFSTILNIVQIVLLILTKNFILYLAAAITSTLISNIAIANNANKLYPFLVEGKSESLDRDEIKSIFKNIFALTVQKIGLVVLVGTSNILISTFIGIYWVGIYSNYSLIVETLNNFLVKIFTSINASVGNLNAVGGRERSYDVYKTIYFLNFWIFGSSSVFLFILLNPFITLWIGEKYIFNQYIVLLFAVNYYIFGMRHTIVIHRNSLGLFWHDRYRPIVEIAVNLITAVILVRRIGIAGVFLGPIISTIAVAFWWEAYILYRHGFNRSVKSFIFQYFIYFGITAISACVTQLICSLFTTITVITLLYRFAICLIVPSLIFYLCFVRTSEFKHLYRIATNLRRKIRVTAPQPVGTE